MVERIDTLVIGGSQAGLAISYFLTREGRPHVVLEKDQIGHSWITERWDSFTLVTPNWANQLPGFPYQGDHPDDFLPRDEIVTYLEDYAASFDAPVRLGVRAHRLSKDEGNSEYRVETNEAAFGVSNVVVATGFFQRPRIPDFANSIPSAINQIHSSEYRNPDTLPVGAVLVVGSAQSGCQIAEELLESGRNVYLAVGSAGRIPRRYRGKDGMYWSAKMGRFDRSFEDPANPVERYKPNPHASGKNGGHAINLHQFARAGMTLLGRVIASNGHKVTIASDLKEKVAQADKYSNDRMTAFDEYIREAELDVPEPNDNNTDDGGPTDGPDLEEILELDLVEREIETIIWATGLNCDFSWIDLPVLNERGYPIQQRGISEYPGLYFCGLHWMHNMKSGLFLGVGDDARHVTQHIADNRSLG